VPDLVGNKRYPLFILYIFTTTDGEEEGQEVRALTRTVVMERCCLPGRKKEACAKTGPPWAE